MPVFEYTFGVFIKADDQKKADALADVAKSKLNTFDAEKQATCERNGQVDPALVDHLAA